MTLHAKISPETSTSLRFIREAPLFLVWLVDQHKLKSVAGGQGREALAFDYLETFLLGAVDTSRAAQNATVAAESLGLGRAGPQSMADRHILRDVLQGLGFPLR